MVLPRFACSFRLALGVWAAIVALPAVQAFDVYYLPTGSSVWNTGNNWADSPGGTPRGLVPNATFEEVAVIATGGTVTLNAAATNPVGGVSLGQDSLDGNVAPGTLTIGAGGSLMSQATASTNGIVRVGAATGTGTLNMSGNGSLNAAAMVSGGANASAINLSGAASLTLGSATFARELHITGPSVVFNSTGAVSFQAGGGVGRYTAEITGANHSVINSTGNVGLGGLLNVVFNGVTPAPGQTWTLANGSNVTGGFSNGAIGADLTVTGATAPVGSAFRLKTTNGGNGKLLQLGLEQLLVLTVNRDTGAMTLRNPTGASVNQLVGYEVNSPRGSLVASYKGISGAPAGDTGWEKAPTNSTTGLGELKPSGTFNVSSPSTSVALGAGFSKTQYSLANGVNGLGTNGEDLTFSYTTFSGAVVRGQVEYTGNQFVNNMALVINGSGQASLKNDSAIPLSVDGYSITSSTGALSGAAWTSLSDRAEARFDNWQETPATANAMSETNSLETNLLTIAPGESFSLGDIGDFSTEAARDGLGLKFLLGNEPTFRLGTIVFSQGLSGNFDGDSDVDGNDFLVWQRGGSPSPLSTSDLNAWKANFGQTAAAAAAAAVPEPSSALLGIAATGLAALLRRRSLAS